MTLPHPLNSVSPSVQLHIFLVNSLCFSVCVCVCVCVHPFNYPLPLHTEKYVTVQMVRLSLGGGEGSLIFSLLWAVSYTHLDVYKRQCLQSMHCTHSSLKMVSCELNTDRFHHLLLFQMDFEI